jgi:hypothetical protein
MDVNRHSRYRATLVFGIIAALTLPATAVAADGLVEYRVIHPISGPLSATPSYFAIRSHKELVSWWNGQSQDSQRQNPSAHAEPKAQPSAAPAPPLPDIDFDHHTLIVANAGSKPSSGFDVAIMSVSVSDIVSVSILETVPGVNCPRATVLTHAEAFALIPNPHLPIRFNIMTAAVDCNAHRSVEAK